MNFATVRERFVSNAAVFFIDCAKQWRLLANEKKTSPFTH